MWMRLANKRAYTTSPVAAMRIKKEHAWRMRVYAHNERAYTTSPVAAMRRECAWPMRVWHVCVARMRGTHASRICVAYAYGKRACVCVSVEGS